jgi:hypothetical protein
MIGLLIFLSVLLSVLHGIEVDSPSTAYHLITYASASHVNLARILLDTALRVGGFNHTKLYTADSLDSFFVDRNAGVLKQPRGAGLWIYKPYVILYHLVNVAQPDDIVLYLDSKWYFKDDFIPTLDFMTDRPPHIGLIWANSRPDFITTGSHSFSERFFSKRDAHIILNTDGNETYLESDQFWCGLVAIRNTFLAVQFISSWLTYVQDRRVVSDDPSILSPEYDGFRYNRHDQSVCSLLAKKWQIVQQELGEKVNIIELQRSYHLIRLYENGNTIKLNREISTNMVAEASNECRLGYSFERCNIFEEEMESLIRQFDEVFFGTPQEVEVEMEKAKAPSRGEIEVNTIIKAPARIENLAEDDACTV